MTVSLQIQETPRKKPATIAHRSWAGRGRVEPRSNSPIARFVQNAAIASGNRTDASLTSTARGVQIPRQIRPARGPQKQRANAYANTHPAMLIAKGYITIETSESPKLRISNAAGA